MLRVIVCSICGEPMRHHCEHPDCGWLECTSRRCAVIADVASGRMTKAREA